ncbi:ABC-F family ATP-binding cassette domain-containing protein [Candidatus Dependentiae bacterium]|nr:ABC-F family ATP-binding cassette domain-containing protein [Candidatus Dependentiae bacterium]
MIILDKITLVFGKQTVFDAISCTISNDNRIGLVGRNGSGKSTLLKVISGQQGVDGGTVSIEKGATIGYMPQEVVLQSDKTIYQETFSVFDDMNVLLAKAKQLESALERDPDESLVEQYADVQQKLSEYDVQKAKVDTKKILTGLGFEGRLDEPVSSLSVGWRMRVVLAKLLLQRADFYLFDEPTNHLDIVTKDWFLHFLKNASFGFMLVCHDRYFLDHLCTKTLELELGKATLYHGNYTFYAEQKVERVRELEAAALRQKKELAQKMKTVERFRASASKAKMAQAMLKKVKKIERIEVATQQKTVAFSFPPVVRSGRVVLKVEGVAHAFDEKQIFKNVSFEVERGEKVALVAPNGLGKTTLFNLITGRLALKTGAIELGYNVSSTIFEQEQDKVLSPDNTILNEVESACRDSETRSMVRKFLGAFLFSGDDVDKKIRVLSGGEKNRVAMVKVLLQHANLLLLDEPTNHLDIQSKEVLLNALRQFKGTILFVSHDRDFLDKLATRILELTPDGVVSYPGNYESYIYHKGSDEISEHEKLSKTVGNSSNKEQYEQRRNRNKLEGKIDRLEKKIHALNEQLELLEYGTDRFTQVYDQLLGAQKQLDESVAEWEQLT